MRRFIFALLILTLIISGRPAYAAKNTTSVKLEKCIDGDTAKFTIVGNTRFLYVDTPESVNQVEPYGKEAATYTCRMLTNAKSIELEYDGPTKDKYNRTLAWVWVDGKLIQSLLIQKGYVEKFYDYGTYKYETVMISLQATAKNKKVGLWSKLTPTPTPTPNQTQTDFKNCTELRKVYPNGVYSGHPAYQKKMDRDGDGHACE